MTAGIIVAFIVGLITGAVAMFAWTVWRVHVESGPPKRRE
jgi:predicted negative regulator of RcsB-dependent stress response